MRKKNILVIGLHVFFALAFWIITVFIVIQIGFEAFTIDGKAGSISAGNHHSKGYNIPVRLRAEAPNTVFNNNWSNIKSTHTDDKGQKSSYGTLERFIELSVSDKIGVKNVISIQFPNNEEVFTTNQHVTYAQGYLVAKSKNSSFLILQLVKNYVGFMCLALIFYLLMKIFKSLKKDLNFTPTLFKMIRLIGWVVIFSTSFELVMSYVIGKKYYFVKTETLVDNTIFNGVTKFSMNPRLEFDFMFFIIGFSLLVLASLLKKGSLIQQENDLTI
ncbi:DUF2975 domain-containing protein [Psychroserpens sp. AS72]|uniref:DUF2975 domain-containing protein n=1 Tax=Psychroserpens sp. AS72 TaxID=3135775 RepID=UPI0031807314